VDTNARAQRIDREMGSEYARFNVASGLATAIFFGSFSGSQRRGVNAPSLRMALLREEIPPAIVGDALGRMEEALWYLHCEGGLYQFRSQPNLNRSRIITVALQGTAMNVVQQTRGDDDRVWFLVDINLDGALVQGWVLRELVVELTECPPPL